MIECVFLNIYFWCFCLYCNRILRSRQEAKWEREGAGPGKVYTIADQTMDLAAVKILLLSQGNQSLERHTQAFLDLQHLVHYDDTSLCQPPETELEGHLGSTWTGREREENQLASHSHCSSGKKSWVGSSERCSRVRSSERSSPVLSRAWETDPNALCYLFTKIKHKLKLRDSKLKAKHGTSGAELKSQSNKEQNWAHQWNS